MIVSIYFARLNYDYWYIYCLCFALKTLTRCLFYVFHYLCEIVMVICVSLCTVYSNEMYSNLALYRAFHFLNLYVKWHANFCNSYVIWHTSLTNFNTNPSNLGLDEYIHLHQWRGWNFTHVLQNKWKLRLSLTS